MVRAAAGFLPIIVRAGGTCREREERKSKEKSKVMDTDAARSKFQIDSLHGIHGCKVTRRDEHRHHQLKLLLQVT